jgi:Tfp pilus assembly protein PilX
VNKKGVALYFVLAILLVVIILANVVLNFVSSQQRLTSHQVKRVQAYYAAQAGINYALEQLRLNNATYNNSGNGGTWRICGTNYKSSNPPTTTNICNGVGNLTEPTFPPSINFIDVTIGVLDTTYNNRTVNATVNYTSAY